MTHLNANQSGTPGTPKDTSMKPALLRFRRITVAATLLGLLGTGAALAHGVDAGVQVEVVGEPSWSLSPVYHILMAHPDPLPFRFGIRGTPAKGSLASGRARNARGLCDLRAGSDDLPLVGDH